MALLLEALHLSATYNGEVEFLFGQNFGLRQPLFRDPSTKKRLAPEPKIFMEPLFDYPELGGVVKLHFHDGVIAKATLPQKSTS